MIYDDSPIRNVAFPGCYFKLPECNIFFGVKPDHMAYTTMVGLGLVGLRPIMLRPSPHQHTLWCGWVAPNTAGNKDGKIWYFTYKTVERPIDFRCGYHFH